VRDLYDGADAARLDATTDADRRSKARASALGLPLAESPTWQILSEMKIVKLTLGRPSADGRVVATATATDGRRTIRFPFLRVVRSRAPRWSFAVGQVEAD
jgi:hypothetical protein